MAEIPPAWHADPTGSHDHRWWDGQRWTEHVADAGVAAVDPLPAAPGDPGAGATDTGTTGAGGTGAGVAGATGAAAASGGGPTADAAPASGAETGQPVWGGQQDTGQPPAGSDPAWGASGAAAGGGAAGQQPAWPGTEPQPAWGASDQPAWGTDDRDDGAVWAGGPNDTPTGTGDRNATSGLAITALVLGILAIPSAIVLIGGLLGLVAIILGVIASSKAKRGQAGGRGLAIGGIITGAVGLVIAIGLFAFVFANIADEAQECIERTGDAAACQNEIERNLMDRFG